MQRATKIHDLGSFQTVGLTAVLENNDIATFSLQEIPKWKLRILAVVLMCSQFFLLTLMPDKQKAAADVSDINKLDIIKEEHDENKPWGDVIRDEIIPEVLENNPGGVYGFSHV
jgi:hypothetical protein